MKRLLAGGPGIYAWGDSMMLLGFNGAGSVPGRDSEQGQKAVSGEWHYVLGMSRLYHRLGEV